MARSRDGAHPANNVVEHERGEEVEIPLGEPPQEFLIPAPLLQLILNTLAGLPYNHQIGEGRICGDLVNTLRQLRPVGFKEPES